MRSLVRLLILLAFGIGLAACSGTSGKPSTQPPVDTTGIWLRASISRTSPPANRFAIGPTAVITDEGMYVTAGLADAGRSGPLLPSLIGRQISDTGRDAIQAEAGRLGLLGRTTDFRGVAAMPGDAIGRLDLTVDGSVVTLRGLPDSRLMCIIAPCDPLPGTPEAFGELWRMLADPAPWLSADLGPEAPFVADSYAVLIGPVPDGGGDSDTQIWPLDAPLATFGSPVVNGTLRCGIVGGADADRLRPALEAANRLTGWAQDESSSATFGLVVRPTVASENPCAETFVGG